MYPHFAVKRPKPKFPPSLRASVVNLLAAIDADEIVEQGLSVSSTVGTGAARMRG